MTSCDWSAINTYKEEVHMWLTGAAETLFAESHEEVETEVAVGWLVEVLQSPAVSAVIFHILQQQAIVVSVNFY